MGLVPIDIIISCRCGGEQWFGIMLLLYECEG